MRSPFAPALALLLALAAGCSKGAGSCPSACRAGTHCDDASGACLPDPADLAGTGGEACSPACSSGAPKCNPSGHCVACLVDGDCPIGSYCNVVSNLAAVCSPGCKDAGRCAAGQGCCGNQCVDLMTRPDHCGACATSCSGLHAAGSCVGGACTIGACSDGWGDCNNDPKDGCEANLHTDPNNCTACGRICTGPHAVSACADGCYPTSCQFGYADCDGDPKNGCETSVSVDPVNCGGCGMKCGNLPNATATCINAVCVIGMCSNGYTDCDNDPKNGCEANTAFDAKNCGKCGNVCPMNNPACNSGVCGANLSSFNVMMKQDITYQGINYLLLKVSMKSSQSNAANWCYEYMNLCQSFGYQPTGCGSQFTMQNNGYGTCRTMYMSDGISNTLGCNPSGGVSAAARAAGFNDATGTNSFAFHFCDGNTCSKTMCAGANCNTSLSYIDMNQPFGYTLCKKP